MFNFNTIIMKKFNLFNFLLLFAIFIITFSCNKNDTKISSTVVSDNEGNDNFRENEATWITSGEANSKWWLLKIVMRIGHTIDQCGGKCVKIFGELGHIDCRGYGNVCNHVVIAQLVQSTGGLMLVLEDPDSFGDDLDFFLPDRTFYITNPLNNSDLWLNIPEQVLTRTNSELPFEILDIWFSEEPELENK